MREIKIDRREAGQRFDKYLKKYLSQAGSGFIYKMLRKKNITLNGSKASGNEILSEGDVVKMFFSEETFEKYTGVSEDKNRKVHDGLSINVLEGGDCRTIVCGRYRVGILYEDSDVIFFNKPAGLLSQGDGKGDVSLVDILEAYINQITRDRQDTGRESVIVWTGIQAELLRQGKVLEDYRNCQK